MKAIYLKFPDEQTAEVVKDYEGRDVDGYSVDILGKIYDVSGDPDNETVTELPGFHVNMLVPDDFIEFSEYEVFPNTPRRIFAGWGV